MAAGTIALTDTNFDAEVMQSSVPVLVDFGAAWCGPCRALAPIVEELAKEYAGRVKVATVDIDKASAVAGKFSIMSVPTLIFFKGGKPTDKVIGLKPKADLKARMDKLLA
ncbi:MAG: thioredoxin [Planctomycetia bacterium]